MQASGGARPAPGTLNQLFFEAVSRFDRPNALQVKVGGSYKPVSHRELDARIRRAAAGLAQLGARAGDRVAILSENRPEWVIADYACLTSGLTDVPIYPSLPAEQIAYVLKNSGAIGIFVSTKAQAEKIVEARRAALTEGGTSLPALRFVIAFDQVGDCADMTLDQLEKTGAADESPAAVAAHRQRALAIRPDDVATIIYTSGTTGDPKGVMLTHDNIFSNVMAVRDEIPFGDDDVSLSFLPLSHIFERSGGYYMLLATGTSIAYAESFDAVPRNLLEVKPTIVLSVPRLYEKMYARVLDAAMSGGFIKKNLFFWAKNVAERWADEKLAGREPGGILAAKYSLAQKLVFSKVKARTGGRLRYFVSGGAPLATEINKFFYAAGLVVLEGYGLTETSPVIAVNTPKALRMGTVGRPIAGVEVKIAGDGEILTRGPNVMKGYFNNPEATREAIDAEGWFSTGDIGELRDGFLAITDRKKDIIVTAGGKKIAPQPMENRVRTNKYVSQAVMIGDKRKFPVILIVPNFDQLGKWAARNNITATEPAELLKTPAVREKMEQEVLGELSDLARFEMPKKVALLEHDFSAERGELTPTQKVKRRVIDKQYKPLIDSLYEE
jgi:long-chain acyl-CoA synthetase